MLEKWQCSVKAPTLLEPSLQKVSLGCSHLAGTCICSLDPSINPARRGPNPFAPHMLLSGFCPAENGPQRNEHEIWWPCLEVRT